MKNLTIFGLCIVLLAGCGQNKESMQNKEPMGNNNSAIEAIMSRTSIREYTDEAISDADMETLLRAGMAAPSCCNIQPWHFIVIKDQSVRQQMTDSIGPAQPAAKAQAVIVVCGDMNIMNESPVKDNTDYWVCDACAATENILIAANALGLGGVWMGVWPMTNRISKIQSILGLPDYIIPLDMIALGHPAEQPQPKDKWNPERIHQDRW